MRYRCANNFYGYCSDVPKWGKLPKTLGAGGFPGDGSCKLNPKTCSRYQTLAQQLEEKELPKGESYRHVMTARKRKKK